MTQRPIGHALYGNRQPSGSQHASDDGQNQIHIGHHQRSACQNSESIQGDQDFDPDKRTHSKDFTMRKIDEFENAVHHGVAQSDGGIDKADCQPIDGHLRQIDQGVGKQRHVQPFEKRLPDHGSVEDQGKNQDNGRQNDRSSQ